METDIQSQYDFFKNARFTDDGKLIMKLEVYSGVDTASQNQYDFFKRVEMDDNKIKVAIK